MNLKEYLLPSHSIEVSATTEDEDHKPIILKLRTVVETGYENGFFKIVAPMYHGRLYNFHVDEQITVTFTTQVEQKKEAYDLKCRIVSRNHRGNLYTITLKALSEPEKVQRRQAFRVNVFNTYTFNYKDKEQQIVTKDISSTGLRGLTTIQMSKGDQFTIKFNANTKEEDEVSPEDYAERLFTLQCRVIDCMPQTEIRRYMQRIQFVNMTSKQSKYLVQYLYAKQSEIIFTEGSDSNQRDLMEHYLNYQENEIHIDERDSRNVSLISLISFFLFFLSFVFFLYAQPTEVYGLDRFFRYYRAQAWNSTYFVLAFGTTLGNIAFSIYGLIFNASKFKSQNDHFNRLLIATLGLSIILLFVLIYFLSTTTIFTSNKVY